MATETGDSTEDATETGDSISSYMRSVTVTSVSTLLGMVAAVLSTLYATENGEPQDMVGLMFLFVAVAVQLGIYKAIGIDVEGFGAKDYLYIVFMTFVLWFVTWSIFLTTGALQ